MSKSKIEWTDSTWPVVTGCTHAGTPGCDMCYAARMAATRLRDHPRYKGLATFHNGKARWTGKINLNHDVLEQPLHWRKPRMVFIASMSDLFHPDVPWDFVWQVIEVIRQCPQHTFQILTKRPGMMAGFFRLIATNLWPLSNLWLGTSVENQAAADERREYLKQCPAAVKFVSYEPALGPINWTGWEFVSQIISGGESGLGARPSHPDWHRATRDFCQANGIAYFMKQWGVWLPFGQKHVAWNAKSAEYFQILADRLNGTNRHLVLAGNSGRQDFYHVGKKRAGRLLDGRAWREFPVSAKVIA